MGRISKKIVLAFVCSTLVLAGSLPALAQAPIPITAEQAFDAVQMQKDPLTGKNARVVLVDVRTRAEYYWVGTTAKVNTITLHSGTVVVPDFGKVKLENNGTFIAYQVDGVATMTLTQDVKSMSMAAIGYHVPFQSWDEGTGAMSKNTAFGADMAQVAGNTKPTLILFCRSGGRTDSGNAVAALDVSLFGDIYEIDQPDGATNNGGMEGSDYSKVYNGYRGFPERYTWSQAHPAVSWKDAGLPIVIGATPPALPSKLPPPVAKKK